MASRFFLQSVAGCRYARSEKNGLFPARFDFGTYTAATRMSKFGTALEDSALLRSNSVARTQSFESGEGSPKSATERCDCAKSLDSGAVWECAHTVAETSRQAQKPFIT